MVRRQKGKLRGRGKQRALTDMEWIIMDVVWESEPCAAGTVQEALEQSYGWAYSTIKTTMDRMVGKGLLTTSSIRNLTLFSSALTREEAKRGELRHTLRRAFGGALSPMLQLIAEDEKLSDEDLKELRKIVGRTKRRKQ